MQDITALVKGYYYRSSHRPWEASFGMVRVAPHCWYVGDEWLGVVLIESGDGIIMIDSGIRGQMWLIFESIRKLGYDPEKDIKLCLISHAHADHTSGIGILQNYAHPVVHMSEEEKHWADDPERYLTTPREVDIVPPYTADHYYDYKTPIVHGNFSIEVVFTPGHSPGTSSFFFDDVDEDGTIYRVGLHGGMGVNVLTDDRIKDKEEAISLRRAHRKNLEAIRSRKVDITITNHGMNICMKERLPEDKNDFKPFVDPTYWEKHVDKVLAELDEIERNTVYRED